MKGIVNVIPSNPLLIELLVRLTTVSLKAVNNEFDIHVFVFVNCLALQN